MLHILWEPYIQILKNQNYDKETLEESKHWSYHDLLLIAFSSMVSKPSIFESLSNWPEFLGMERGPDPPPESANGDSSARVLVWLFDLVDDLDDPPTEDSFGFFLRDILGVPCFGGDELPRAWSTLWWDFLEVSSVHSLAGDWEEPFKDLLGCLDFSDFNLVGESTDEMAAAEQDCRLDDFGSSGRSRAGEPCSCSEPHLRVKSENNGNRVCYMATIRRFVFFLEWRRW